MDSRNVIDPWIFPAKFISLPNNIWHPPLPPRFGQEAQESEPGWFHRGGRSGRWEGVEVKVTASQLPGGEVPVNGVKQRLKNWERGEWAADWFSETESHRHAPSGKWGWLVVSPLKDWCWVLPVHQDYNKMLLPFGNPPDSSWPS